MSSPQDANNPLRNANNVHFQRPNTSASNGTNATTTSAGTTTSSSGYEGLLKHATVSHVSKDGKKHTTPVVPVSAGTHASSNKQQKVGKVQLAPGYSQMDWMRLTRTKNNNLNGFGGKKVNVSKRVITLEEIAQHNTEEDAWVGFRGKVYNLTPYIHFHPGGAKILEQAFGTDCTALFDKFHKYVNGEFMMRECQVGVMPGFVNDDEEDEDDDDF
jgi:cytochrome b involved in lipid metabolism